MVTRHRRSVHQRASASRKDAQSGSAVVAALALALLVAVIGSSVTARGLGTVIGAAAAHDRLQARTVAEELLHVAIIATDDTSLTASLGTGGAGSALSDLARALEASHGGDALVQVDLSDSGDDVTVRVDATVGTTIATATALLRPRTSTDLAWLAESRARDPMLQGLPRLACTWPSEDPRRHPACRDMPMPVGAIGGPIHSNDRLPDGIDAPAHAHVTSSAVDVAGTSHRSEMILPRDAATVLQGRPPTCRFRGPTLLRLDGPRIRVTSPRSIPRDDEPHGADVAIGCLDVDRSLLAGIVVIELPERAIIEVIADVADDCVLHPLGLDAVEDRERAWPCDAGDAFVWGRYTGARTVVAHDSIQILWDLEPGGAAAARSLHHGDTLGLVAGDSVVLRRPIGRDPATLREQVLAFGGAGIAPFGTYPLDAPNPAPTHWDAPQVVAAVAALRGSLAPQNSGHGAVPSGPITLVGSMAARFAPATSWDLFDRRGRPAGRRDFPLVLTYDARLSQSPPPAMPHVDDGRLRIVELDVG